MNSVAISHPIEFQQQKDLHDKQLPEQCKQSYNAVTPTSYSASIVDDAFGIFITVGWIKDASVNEIRKEKLIQCVKDRCVSEVNGEQLNLVHNAVKQVQIKMHVEGRKNRVFSLYQYYTLTVKIA